MASPRWVEGASCILGFLLVEDLYHPAPSQKGADITCLEAVFLKKTAGYAGRHVFMLAEPFNVQSDKFAEEVATPSP